MRPTVARSVHGTRESCRWSRSTSPATPSGRGSSRRSAGSRPTSSARPTPTCTPCGCRRSQDVDLYLKDESTHPTGIAQAPAGALAVPLRPVQRADPGGHPRRGGVVRLDGGERGVLRAPPRAAVHRRDGAHDLAVQDRAHRARGRPVRAGRRPRLGVRRRARARRGVRRALPRPVHLRRAGDRLARQQQHRRVDLRPAVDGALPRADSGWSSGPAPAARRPRSAATSATAGWRPGCASSTRRTPRSSPPSATPTAARRPAARGSRASAGRAPSRRSCPTWSTGWCRSPTPRRSPPRTSCAPAPASSPGRRRAPRCTPRPSWPATCAAAGEAGSIVTLLCDDGVRYLDTYFSEAWVAAQGWDLAPYLAVLARGLGRRGWTGLSRPGTAPVLPGVASVWDPRRPYGACR